MSQETPSDVLSAESAREDRSSLYNNVVGLVFLVLGIAMIFATHGTGLGPWIIFAIAAVFFVLGTRHAHKARDLRLNARIESMR